MPRPIELNKESDFRYTNAHLANLFFIFYLYESINIRIKLGVQKSAIAPTKNAINTILDYARSRIPADLWVLEPDF